LIALTRNQTGSSLLTSLASEDSGSLRAPLAASRPAP
jgi:hypothetical protein